MQLRLLLDEGHLVLDNGKFNYDVINTRRDYSEVLCLRAKGRLDELSKLFDSIVAFVNASKSRGQSISPLAKHAWLIIMCQWYRSDSEPIRWPSGMERLLLDR